MLKRISFLLLALVLMSTTVSAADWVIDKAHSSVSFQVKHLVISKVNGAFTDFDGKVTFDGKDLEAGSAEMTIQVSSVDTDNADRDGHLTSPDFFDAENHAVMIFKSTRVVRGEGNKFALVGDLTIKGKTHEVTFDCEFNGVADFMNTTKAGFSAKTTINRQDFGLTWSKTLDSGGLVVGNDVEILIELELNKV